MLNIISEVEELFERSAKILAGELNNIEENRKFNEYEKTIESIYCKLCEIQIELKVGTTKFIDLEEEELERLTDELINRNND